MRPLLKGILALGIFLGLTVLAAPVTATHGGSDSGCGFPVTETDASGTEVRLPSPAETVVVTDASSAQVFWELNATDKVVGLPVEAYTEYLAGAAAKTDVTDGQQILVERIIELEPDLVIVPNYADETTIHQLRDSGLTVYQLGLEDSIAAIYRKTRLYGHFTNKCKTAEETVAQTQADITAIEEAVEGRQRPRVLYYFFGFTAGDDTFIHDLLTIAGGTNLAAQAGIEGYQEISDEVVVETDPEWIVSPSHAGLPDDAPYESTTAMEKNQTLVVDENLVSQAAPRVVIPLRQMATAFHPSAFEENSDQISGPETDVNTGSGSEAGVVAIVGSGILVLLVFAYLWRRNQV